MSVHNRRFKFKTICFVELIERLLIVLFCFYLFFRFCNKQKLCSDTHKPDEDQLIVHCTIFGNPEPTIRWFKEKIPLNLFNLPRYTIFNHPDDLHEHTIASLIVLGPSFLDNGNFIIEIENEAGFERRVLNVQFQTEEEYNAIYFKKYLEHKENLKYHQYQPGEQRWEDIVPEVKEFVFWEPPEEENASKNKKKRKKKRKILKTIITPWGDEKQVEVTDEEDSGESVYGSEDEEEAEEQEEEEEEEDLGWNVPGEVAASDEEEEEVTPAKPAVVESATETPAAVEPLTKTPAAVEPLTETPAAVEPEAEKPTADVEAQSDEAETAAATEPAAQTVESSASEKKAPEQVEQSLPEPEAKEVGEALLPKKDVLPAEAEDGACWFDDFEEEVDENFAAPPTPFKRKSPEVEHPIILRRPKFYITDFQLRKKFFFVNKLIDVEMMKGKTLRMESFSASIGPVTCEWRHNGRLVKAPTARKSIEFYTRKNMTVLEIENVRVQDSGTYTVTHYNDYTEPLIDSCKVLITVPQPKETADQPPTFTRLLTGINHYRLIKL